MRNTHIKESARKVWQRDKEEEDATHRVQQTSQHAVDSLELPAALLVVPLEVDVPTHDNDGGDDDFGWTKNWARSVHFRQGRGGAELTVLLEDGDEDDGAEDVGDCDDDVSKGFGEDVVDRVEVLARGKICMKVRRVSGPLSEEQAESGQTFPNTPIILIMELKSARLWEGAGDVYEDARTED
jgi:hypothetical protein